MTKTVQRIDPKAVQTRILSLYDDAAELQDHCSFLCDAFTALARFGEAIDEPTVRGAVLYAECLKERVERFKAELRLGMEEVSILASLASSHGSEGH